MDKSMAFITLTPENVMSEHLCCAIADKKHQTGVNDKRNWLAERIKEGHVFRKLDAQGKVFIEYAPLEKAWVPVTGDNYFYIYCLWVSGSYKGKGYGKELLQSCIDDAKAQGKSGICLLSSKKKKPFLSEKKFMLKYGFKVVDTINDEYELLALSFDGTQPQFTSNVRKQSIEGKELTIYYGVQCPYIPNCIEQIYNYCENNQIPLRLVEIDTLEKAWVPVTGDNYFYIYCLWVSGSYKGKGYGKELLQSCIDDAKAQGKSGICLLSSKKKKPFLSEKKFMLKYGFKVVDTINDEYELLALSFDGTQPQFTSNVRKQSIEGKELTIYYGVQCPYIPNCIEQIYNYCENNQIPLRLVEIDTLEKAKQLPCIFNNWAVFYNGKFETVHLLNEGLLKKLLLR